MDEFYDDADEALDRALTEAEIQAEETSESA